MPGRHSEGGASENTPPSPEKLLVTDGLVGCISDLVDLR
jgi:hypothetical protein